MIGARASRWFSLAHRGARAGGRSGSSSALLFLAAGAGRLYLSRRQALVARKLPGLRRELDARLALLGRLRRDRLVDLLRARDHRAARASASRRSCCSASASLFLLVALSYAEATSALPETGGAATFVRRALERPRRLHDRLGALPRLPDRDRALGALRPALPRGRAPGRARSTGTRGTSIVGVGVIVCVGLIRLVRRPSFYAIGFVVPALDVITQLVLIVLRLRRSSSRRTRSRTAPRSARRRPWHSLAVRDPARDARLHRASRPSRTSPRRRAGPASTCRARSSSRSAPSSRPTSRSPSSRSRPSRARSPSSARAGCARRSSASPSAIRAAHRRPLGDAIRFFVGVSGALILLASVTTSISGFSPPRLLARRARPAAARVRPPAPPDARLAAGDRQRRRDLERDRDRLGVRQARRRVPRERLLVRRPARVHGDPARGDQAADRRARPAAARTARRSTSRSARPRSRCPRSSAPSSPSRSGSSRSRRTPARATPAPAWLAIGLVVYVAVRRSHGEGLTERVVAPDTVPLRRRAALPPDPRADEARGDRRGDGRDGGQARGRAPRGRRGALRRRSCRSTCRSTRRCPRPRRGPRRRSQEACALGAGARRRGRGDHGPRPRDRARDRRPRPRAPAPT